MYDALFASFSQGLAENMSFDTVVDPSLVAGMTIEVGDKYMDMSAATQLKKMQAMLMH